MPLQSSHRRSGRASLRLRAPAGRRYRCSILRRGLSLALAAAGCVALSAAWGATYKWTDEQGRVHYGDSIPPTEIHRPYTEIDKRGQVNKKIDAAPTAPEREAQNLRLQQQEAEREEARRNAIRDQYLMETYQDAAQVRAAYDAKLSSLDSSITLANSVVEKLAARRALLMKNAAAGERGGEATDRLQKEIKGIDQQIAHQHRYIEERRGERGELEEDAVRDIARFEELRAGMR